MNLDTLAYGMNNSIWLVDLQLFSMAKKLFFFSGMVWYFPWQFAAWSST